MPIAVLLRVGAALALGAIAPFGFAPYDQKWLLPLVFAALFRVAEARGCWRAAAYGWLFGMAYFITGDYWLFISTHVYGGASAASAVSLLAVLFTYMSFYPGLAMGLSSWLGLFRRPLGWIGLPALWILGELLRGWVYSGYPWLSLGYASLDTPLSNFAPLLGVYFVSGLVIVMALALFRLAFLPTRRWLSGLVLVLPAAVGVLLPRPSSWSEPHGSAVNVAIVQGDERQDDKWAPAMRPIMLARHRQMTEQALAASGQAPDLVLWPESALPISVNELNPSYLEGLRDLLRPHGSTLLFGSIYFGPGDVPGRERVYNSAVAIGAQEGRYDKRHLVPFGEYFPIPDFLRPLMVWLGTNYEDISPGPADQPLFTVRGEKFFTGICFEDVFGSEFRHDGRDANFLVNLTNDAWFGHSSAQAQHLQFSRLRTIEYSRWMARSTTTGLSAFIDADGTVLAHGGSFDQELLQGRVEPRTGATPYTRVGDAPLWISTALLIAAMIVQRRRRTPSTVPPPST